MSNGVHQEARKRNLAELADNGFADTPCVRKECSGVGKLKRLDGVCRLGCTRAARPLTLSEANRCVNGKPPSLH